VAFPRRFDGLPLAGRGVITRPAAVSKVLRRRQSDDDYLPLMVPLVPAS
jgi:hypothetical protein